MTHQSANSKFESQKQSEARYRRTAISYGERIESRTVGDELWLQIDQWVNEGGALGSSTAPSAKLFHRGKSVPPAGQK
jgi:hypothetical protein